MEQSEMKPAVPIPSRRILPEIELYDDYRHFLQDYYDLNKAVDPSFSYRYLSRRAGFSSSAFYKRVMTGIRNLTEKSVEKTCMMMRLTEQQARCFRELVFTDGKDGLLTEQLL
jgi:uncharacterized protein (TIGR02147 family)